MKSDLTGRQFGRLTVVRLLEIREYKYFHKKKNRQVVARLRKYECLCSCGRSSFPFENSLRSGRATSCGCFKDETFLANLECEVHGKSRSRIYHIYGGMKQRCLNPKANNFKNYGGRGIKICEEWIQSFTAFYAYVGDPPSMKYTIDRINNDGNYEPGNVRWATRSEQQKNRRKFHWKNGSENHHLRRKRLGLL